MGLPAEGLSAQRIKRRWPDGWKHRLLPGRGMVSDDTEHTVMVAQALIAAPRDATAFQRELARQLRWWFVRLPAGVGLATARSCLKLWLGFAPEQTGVFAAGNGPAMRSAVIGVFFADDPPRRREFVKAATRLTHTDPKAEVAALAVAEWAALATRMDEPAATWLSALENLSGDAEWRHLSSRLREAWTDGETVEKFAHSLGLGDRVSGYAYHTVPVALYACLKHRESYEAAVTSAMNCGGDTDTVGAITGALAGIRTRSCLPRPWLDGLRDWPCTKDFLRQLATVLEACSLSGQASKPPRTSVAGSFVRNLFFLAVVLVHGFGRLVLR